MMKSGCFCMSPEVQPPVLNPGSAPVYLNVYDLTPVNDYVYWVGVGIFHTGIEVHGVEYAFGAHDYASSGVFEVQPRQCPGFKFRKSIFMGTTCLDQNQIREFMEHHSINYYGSVCNCILPESLQINAVRHDDYKDPEGEKARLRGSSFFCMSSFSMLHSTSSPCLSSSCALSVSNDSSLKERELFQRWAATEN